MHRLLPILALLAACNPEAAELEAELCDALAGQGEAADLAVQPGDGPDLVADGRVYALSMPSADQGYARFTPPAAGGVVFGFAEAVGVTLYGEEGQVRSEATVQGGCAELAVRHSWDLAVEEHMVELSGAEVITLVAVSSDADL